MLIYFIIYFLILVSPQFTIGKRTLELEKHQYDKHIFFMMGLLMLMLALRHQSMGVDLGYGGVYYGYLGSFSKISSYSWNEVIDLPSFKL